MKIVYFKIYQDREEMDGRYYVDTYQGIDNSMPDWVESNLEGEPFPVIEPVLMTEEEFKALPEFQGY